jgi:hypothetical protein
MNIAKDSKWVDSTGRTVVIYESNYSGDIEHSVVKYRFDGGRAVYRLGYFEFLRRFRKVRP